MSRSGRRGSSRRRRGGRPLPLAFKLVASGFVLACFLVVCEGLARLAAPVVPTWQGEDNGGVVMVGHPERLWSMGPGERLNGGTTATISELGLREPIPPVPRPAGRQRVLIVGDSTFFGHGVSDGQTLGAQLQALLQAQGLDADVVNAAIPGYSTEQTRMLLDDVGWDLEPTLVLVGNLWSDNNFDHFRDADLLRTRAAFTSGLAARSAFMRLLAGWIDGLRGESRARVVTWTRSSTFPDTGVRRVPVRDYASNLDAIVRDAAAHGAGAAFIAPANRDTVVDGLDASQPWIAYFDAQRRVAACHGLPIVGAMPAFQGAMAEGSDLDDLFIDEMHPTTRGHGVLARAAASTLLAAGWPGQPLRAVPTPCDLAEVEDTIPGGRSDDMNQLSPQSNLFPNTGTPGGPQAATVGEGERLPPGAWVVSGQVTAPSWPVRVAALDVEARPLASTVLSGADSELRLVVVGGLDRVEVVATDPDGNSASAMATPQGARISLEITP